MTDAEEEVLLVDQERINEFGKLNNRLLEIRADLKQFKEDIEKLEDSVSDLMMGEGDAVMLFVGESFLEVSEEYATEYCNKKQDDLQNKMTMLQNEEKTILDRQSELKKLLYGKFGTSINLES